MRFSLHTSFRRRSAAFVVCLLIFGFALPAKADPQADFAKRLVELRNEVDELSGELENKKRNAEERLRSVSRQRSDLAAQIQRERFRIKRLTQSLESVKSKNSDHGDLSAGLIPAVRESLEILRARVKTSLPFHRKDRLSELDEMLRHLESGRMPPEKVLMRLWAFTDDELRLTKESGLYRQPIVLDGNEVLAEVARIGMVMLFFMTPDGQAGFASRTDGDWEFRAVSDPADRERISRLFESFKKQIRVGFFEIPNALAKGGK